MDRIATVDGASGRTIKATVSLDARGTPLRGSLVTVPCDNDLFLCRIVEVTMTNPIHSDDMFAPTIMKDGNIPFWSGDVDIERADIEIISVFDTKENVRVPMRRNAPSGTSIKIAAESDLELFLTEKKYFLNLGHIPNSNKKLSCSVINRHFGPYEEGGYGEARHTAIFGQSGSGKTVLLTMLIAGRLAAHKDVGLLMPDISGDLADTTRHSRGDFKWNYQEVLDAVGLTIERIPIGDIKLTSPTTLIFKLSEFLRHQFNTNPEKADLLANRVVHSIFDEEVSVDKLKADALLDVIKREIVFCFAEKAKQAEKLQIINDLVEQQSNRRKHFDRELAYIINLFDGRYDLRSLIGNILENGRKVIITMQGINDHDKRFIMQEVMYQLTRKAQQIYHRKSTANAIMVLDEAQRWVPEGADDDEGISELIKSGFRETRKYGLGWIVVAQNPSGLSNQVIRQCHTTYLGARLGIGADQRHIEQMIGKTGAEAYNQLGIQSEYFWVGTGLDNNLGASANYFTLHPFDGDATTEFIKANSHIFYNNMSVAAE